MKEKETFYPPSRQHWRKWLQKNHDKQASIWLICYKMKSGKPTLSWSEAVDEALCFGWIDSTKKSIDEESFMQLFSKRKASGTWSRINKEKIEQLIEQGLMTPAGLACIEAAKQNGSWFILDEVEALTIPKELEKAFKSRPGSKEFFLSLSKSVRKAMLHRVVMARRPETKQQRIMEIVEHAAKKQRPERFR